MKISSFTNMEVDEALDYLGQLIDISLDTSRLKGLDRAIQLGAQFGSRKLTASQFSLLNYFLANAWCNKRNLSMKNNKPSWQWEQEELEKEVIHLRLAIRESGFEDANNGDIYQAMILTNLGNLLSQIGRVVEALEYYEKALRIIPTFEMALGNKGITLSWS